MTNLNIRTVFTLLFIFIISVSISQDVISDTTKSENEKTIQPKLKKNAIYVSGGTLGVTYSFVNGSYERMIWGNKNPVIQSLFIRVSLGWLRGETVSGLISTSTLKATTYLFSAGGLVGKRNSFLEFAAGFMYYDGIETKTSAISGDVISYDNNEFTPAFNLGYRFQKPGGHFIFRLGVGFPEFYYISLGFCL